MTDVFGNRREPVRIMIKTETITIGEKQFIRTYSDRGMMIYGGMPEADYLEVALTLQDQHGNILKNEAFETQYVPAE